ncbi:MAG: hypothetical protein M1827_006735 [Pycnora praestabilis]|nr:MAG: hypothetical protein M1827_006735 [Pycnora praestabilis]
MIIRGISRNLLRTRLLLISPHRRPSSKLCTGANAVALAPHCKLSQQTRLFASQSKADEKVEEIQELYATARDEFEIAQEETENKTIYASDDREAAKEELAKLQDAYKKAVEDSEPDVSADIKRRVGQRIRELEKGVEAMEQLAMED